MTPLYRFSGAHLRDYARLLSAFIAAEKQKGLAVEIGVELDIRVAVSSLPELRGTERDQAALLVQVSSLPAGLVTARDSCLSPEKPKPTQRGVLAVQIERKSRLFLTQTEHLPSKGYV